MDGKTQDLNQSLALTGTIKAVRSCRRQARVSPGNCRVWWVREGDTVCWRVAGPDRPTEYAARPQQAQTAKRTPPRPQVEISRNEPFDNNQPWSSKGSSRRLRWTLRPPTRLSTQTSYRAAWLAPRLLARRWTTPTCTRPWQGWYPSAWHSPVNASPVDARIVEIVDLARLELEATVTPAESVAVRIGQTAQITAKA